MKTLRKVVKMFGRKTRDMLVQTYTIVQRVDENFTKHEDKQDAQVADLYQVIKDCHEQCPEKENFDNYTKAQNGTLLRIEKKYDTFFREHNQKIGKVAKKYDRAILTTNLEVAKVKESVGDIKKAKKCRREIITDWLKYVSVACVIIGTVYAVLRYENSKKKIETLKIEKMLEQILKK